MDIDIHASTGGRGAAEGMWLIFDNGQEHFLIMVPLRYEEQFCPSQECRCQSQLHRMGLKKDQSLPGQERHGWRLEAARKPTYILTSEE
uniref:Uncharacterized protein n=1 Tax=Oryza punctata TaxID=4537 RepID=A0A0E0K0N8_ORYPU